MNNETSVLTEPDSKCKLSELELCEIVKSIAIQIEELKDRYPHFNGYDHNNVLLRSNLIWYKHNIHYEANPNYSAELERREKIPRLKRPEPAQELAIYPEKDGIEIYIEFTEYEIFKNSQRIWLPNYWIGNYAVELKVKGADTKNLKEARKEIIKFILNVKQYFEK